MKKRVYKIALHVSLLLSSVIATAQNFEWKKGASTTNGSGIYGGMGLSSPANNPGARESAITWKDKNGDFWMFGGFGLDANAAWSLLSDMWRYSPVTNEWTWMSGSKFVNTQAVYGTPGVSDPGNTPGARVGATSWEDSFGNLWMFGGYGLNNSTASGELNDLWMYNIILNEWVWMSGSTTLDQPGVYGTMGTSDPSNAPGGRYGSLSWTDANNNLWLYGGTGFGSAPTLGSLNDLWKFDIFNNEWTWINGSSNVDQNGTYGSLGIPASSNSPGSRVFSTGWLDASGNMWMFGGDGYDGSGMYGFLNDLWKYEPLTNDWTWINGSSNAAQTGIYGTQGVPSSLNSPGARGYSISWIDGTGDVWLFGGFGNGAGSAAGNLNDLWKYESVNNEWTWIKGSNNANQAATYGTINVQSPANKPGARNSAVSWIDNSSNLYLFGGSGLTGTSQQGDLNDMWKFWNCHSTVKAAGTRSIICIGETTTLTASSASTYTWNIGFETQTLIITPGTTTSYTVSGTDNYGCDYSAKYTQQVRGCTGLDAHSEDHLFSVYPNPAKKDFTIRYDHNGGKVELALYSITGQQVFGSELNQQEETLIHTELSQGLYLYSILDKGKVVATGKIVFE